MTHEDAPDVLRGGGWDRFGGQALDKPRDHNAKHIARPGMSRVTCGPGWSQQWFDSTAGDMTNHYAQALIEYRGLEGITQAELAERLGVSLRTVNNWENARCAPPFTKQARINDLLGLDVGGGDGFEPTDLELVVAGHLRAESARQMVSQQELADAAGMSQSQMSKVLRCVRPITVGELHRAAELLRLDLTVLLNPKEESA